MVFASEIADPKNNGVEELKTHLGQTIPIYIILYIYILCVYIYIYMSKNIAEILVATIADSRDALNQIYMIYLYDAYIYIYIMIIRGRPFSGALS